MAAIPIRGVLSNASLSSCQPIPSLAILQRCIAARLASRLLAITTRPSVITTHPSCIPAAVFGRPMSHQQRAGRAGAAGRMPDHPICNRKPVHLISLLTGPETTCRTLGEHPNYRRLPNRILIIPSDVTGSDNLAIHWARIRVCQRLGYSMAAPISCCS